jgi:hypothetical protein
MAFRMATQLCRATLNVAVTVRSDQDTFRVFTTRQREALDNTPESHAGFKSWARNKLYRQLCWAAA